MRKKKNWHGLMKVLEIKHLDTNGTILWEQRNILNTFHYEGEEFLLRAAFTGGQDSTIIPETYYLGLDNRTTVDAEDTLDDLIGEPSGGGYERQGIASSGDFGLNFENGHWIATSPIVAFFATTGSWGPVRNIFLTSTVNNSGSLISTSVLPSAVTLESGQSVTMRIGLTLKECP